MSPVFEQIMFYLADGRGIVDRLAGGNKKEVRLHTASIISIKWAFGWGFVPSVEETATYLNFDKDNDSLIDVMRYFMEPRLR